MKQWIWIVCLLSLSCSTSPEGRRQMVFVPNEQMEQLGAQSFTEVKKKMAAETDMSTTRYVECVAQHLLRANSAGTNWEIVVFKEESANAFALPGRKIGVHTGLLKVATNPDQLAAVIGHEIGHVLARHGAERVSETMAAQGGLMLLDMILNKGQVGQYPQLMGALGLGIQGLVILPHSRGQESEADILGLRMMAKAGFNPKESLQLWRNMAALGGQKPPEFLSTHPANETRIENLRAHLHEVEGDYKAAASKPQCVKK
jgi:predicted Zn-dependent protease